MSVRRNTLINTVGSIVPMGVMLITVPMYLAVLGEARYGVLALVWLVLGYFSFLEMGLGKATSNQLAQASSAPSSERAEIFWTALTLNIALGVGGASLLWFAGDYLLAHVLKMPADFRLEVQAALPWLVATFPLALVSSVLNGALEGRNQFFVLNVLQVSSNAAFQIVPLAFAWVVAPTLEVVIAAAVLTRASMNFFYLYACGRIVPLRGMPKPRRARAQKLFTYGGWVAITSAAAPLLDTVERFIIGAIGGAVAVTYYSVPMQLVGKVKVLPSALSRALFPTLSSVAKRDGLILATRAVRSLSLVMTLIVIATLLALRPFLELWVGVEIAEVASPIGEVLLIGVWFNSIAHVPYFQLQAQGRPDIVARLHIIELPFYVGAAWLAMRWGGLMGVALIWVTRCAIEAVILLGLARILSNSVRYLVAQGSLVVLVIYLLHASPELKMIVRALMLVPLVIVGLRILPDLTRSSRAVVRAQ